MDPTFSNDFEACFRGFTLPAEGGYDCDPRDDGNWTSGQEGSGTLVGSNMGISAPVLIAATGAPVTADQMRSLTQDQAEAIYWPKYWRAMNCDQLPRGVKLMVSDFGVNTGTWRSVRELQTIVGAYPDGDLGEMTLAAVRQWTDPGRLIDALADAETKFYQSLPKFDIYGLGWTRRVVARQQLAHKMAQSGV